MTSISKPDPMKVLLDTYLAELLEMTDEQMLEGQDSAAIRAEGLRLLDASKAAAGRRRLEAARQRLQAQNVGLERGAIGHITAEQARAALRQAAANNDGRYTLAARQLDEMADDDVIRAYLQLKHLEQERGED